MVYLPAILKDGPSRFAREVTAQGARLNCVRISDADLAQIQRDAELEIYARQANRNRQAYDMVPLGTWGR
jgi:hypothetical protein